MVDKIEMSLDDIIKSTKGNRNNSKKGGAARRGGPGGSPRKGGRPAGGFRGANAGVAVGRRQAGGSGGVLKGRNRGGIQKAKFSRGDVNSAWKHDLYDGPKRGGGLKTAGGSAGSGKLLVSNLDYGVSESDIHELFADFGPLKNASVHYDRSGRSLGTADVVFERRADAAKAMKQYNGVPLDGRPMNIQLATSEVPAPVVGRGRLGAPPQRNTQRSPSTGGRRPSGPPRKGPPQQRRGNGPGKTNKPAPTAEELDAELDAYVNDMK